MPARAATPCRKPGCGGLCRDRSGYCQAHQGEQTRWSVHQQGRSTTERGYGHGWRKVRAQVLSRDKGLCQPCRQRGLLRRATAVDHIRAKAYGGTDDARNLQAICAACHATKTQAEARGRGDGGVETLGGSAT